MADAIFGSCHVSDILPYQSVSFVLVFSQEAQSIPLCAAQLSRL